MSKANNSENSYSFESFLSEHKSISGKRKFSSISIYKLALLAGDAAAAMGAFLLGLWLTAGGIFLWDDPGAAIVFFVFSLTSIVFFQTYRLYSYHFLFSLKMHLKSLGKSFCWSLLALSITFFLLNTDIVTYSHLVAIFFDTD